MANMANTSPSEIKAQSRPVYFTSSSARASAATSTRAWSSCTAMQLEGKVIRLDDEFLGNKNISYHGLVNVMVEKPGRFLVPDLLRNASTEGDK